MIGQIIPRRTRILSLRSGDLCELYEGDALKCNSPPVLVICGTTPGIPWKRQAREITDQSDLRMWRLAGLCSRLHRVVDVVVLPLLQALGSIKGG